MGICHGKQEAKSAINNEKHIQTLPKNNTFHEFAKSELFTGHKPVPMKVANEALKSICKIKIQKGENETIYGTGFFMNISNSLKYLVTNCHIISDYRIKYDIEIEIHNHKKMKLNSNNRDIKFYPKPKDITLIEIKQYDEIYSDIKFLDYDADYFNRGYGIYKDIDVFSIEHPLGDDAACASGQIKNIIGFEFEHSIPTDNGSSGCPIILLNNNINLIQVIGIHKEAIYSKQLNSGTFIGEIFNNNFNNNNFDNNFNNNNYNYKNYNDNNFNNGNKKINNFIIAEIDIKDEDINKDIRIINSYEENNRHKEFKKKL